MLLKMFSVAVIEVMKKTVNQVHVIISISQLQDLPPVSSDTCVVISCSYSVLFSLAMSFFGYMLGPRIFAFSFLSIHSST